MRTRAMAHIESLCTRITYINSYVWQYCCKFNENISITPIAIYRTESEDEEKDKKGKSDSESESEEEEEKEEAKPDIEKPKIDRDKE